ncbi:hypothetical protein DAEQUDRAFT_725993 [Daedalea quercina L-15889]|uniref:Uncharacterized protein n=1 Tax=Daedalea quercina L-15889 TaxID=1314783 RepID=A0A165QW64_9APHY|nr:hypothetical protein DAEQUDRAFT_725993 [Daedalea quercina L-15889]
MTEYDYSPEAYERYHAKMSKIHDWALSVPTHPRLANPFTAATNAPSRPTSVVSSVGPSPSVRGKQYTQLRPLHIPETRNRSPPRSSPHRSSHRHGHTLAAPPPPPVPLGIPPSVDYRQYVHTQSQRPRPHPARSSTAPPHPPVPFPSGRAPSRQQHARATYPMDRTHQAQVGYASGNTYRLAHEPGREYVVPAPPPGQSYVIFPPNGGRVQVVHDPTAYSKPGSRGTGSSGNSRSPTKKPLLKRFLASISPTGASSRGPPRSGQPPRRLRRHSTSHF